MELDNPSVQESINAFYFICYFGLIMAIFFRIGVRYALYKILNVVPPYLIKRELVLWGTVGLVMGLFLYMRAAGASPLALRSNFLWVNGTSLVVIFGLAYYAWVEWFEIEKKRD